MYPVNCIAFHESPLSSVYRQPAQDLVQTDTANYTSWDLMHKQLTKLPGFDGNIVTHTY